MGLNSNVSNAFTTGNISDKLITRSTTDTVARSSTYVRSFPTLSLRIDDYAKMADHGRSDFCTVNYIGSLGALGLRTIANKFAVSNHTVLILRVHALRSYLKLICEYELHSLPNKKVCSAKDHGKNYIKVRPPLVRHFSVITYKYTAIPNLTVASINFFINLFFRIHFISPYHDFTLPRCTLFFRRNTCLTIVKLLVLGPRLHGCQIKI